ncbi:hypothetical protein DLJ48_02085 [Oenococcus sicerae]|uniref:Uncharacterized protein n=1 Tax=Oenococcus sicerae TaxID=2203724 RepID=A0ABX5QKX1_9LACO|nr:hypothetical protein [Oenococcus sicerae]QAS69395.1 hypothetical protein DLJ48_02085 [Oenococcus sicerae]VDK14539.1 hypothetical protein OAL24_01339 [Oenococcus sicerae]
MKTVSLKSSQEQLLINDAITQLAAHKNEQAVLAELKRRLSGLAVQQNISAEGLKLLSAIQQPDFSVDYALSSMTWFQ